MMIGTGKLGMGSSGLVDPISQAIAQMEGYNTPGTLAQRNNNPGNLRSGPGQIGTSGGFAVFPDAATGWAALNNQVQLNIDRGLTLNEFFAGKPGVYAGYAPSGDANNPSAYAQFVASQTGLDPNAVIGGDSSGFFDGGTETVDSSAFDSGSFGPVIAITAGVLGLAFFLSGGAR